MSFTERNDCDHKLQAKYSMKMEKSYARRYICFRSWVLYLICRGLSEYIVSTHLTESREISLIFAS